jgi:hypothetical protein
MRESEMAWFTEDHYHRIIELLEHIHRRIDAMAVDVSKLAASDARLVADVDTLLTANAAASASLADISAKLAAANAANDPAASAAAQAAIDAVVVALDAESAKVEPPVVTGTTGATGP